MAHQIDIGILTIRDDEFRAVLSAFPDEIGDGIHRGKNREYASRQASAGRIGRYSLAIVRQPEQGNGEAQDAARDLLEDVEPSLLLVVGIAGGLPSDDISLGDIVLSTRINDYSVEARKEGSEPTYAMTGGPVAKQILTGIANLSARARELEGWAAHLPAKPAVKWTRKGQLYGPEEWQRELKQKLNKHYGRTAIPRAPTFMAGPIASSDRLIKDPNILFPWIATARNLLAVEMESGGVYRAAHGRCPMLAIRALSDIVGLRRVDDWTKYAAEAAAAFTRAYLKTSPIPTRSHDAPSQTRGEIVELNSSTVESAAALVKFDSRSPDEVSRQLNTLSNSPEQSAPEEVEGTISSPLSGASSTSKSSLVAPALSQQPDAEQTSNSILGQPSPSAHAVWARLLYLLWHRWLAKAAVHYAAPIEQGILRRSLIRSLRRTTVSFVVYVCTFAYVCLLIWRIQDRDFFGVDASVQIIPFGLSTPPNVFFLLSPLLLIGIWAYHQILLGHALHLVRRLRRVVSDSQARGLDIDLLGDSLQALLMYDAPGNKIVGLVYTFAAWSLPSVLTVVCWYRLLPVRSSLWGWLHGNSLPSATSAAILCIVMTAMAAVWSTARASLDSHVRRGAMSHTRLLFAVCVVFLGTAPLYVQLVYRYQARPLNLEKAVLSKRGTSADAEGAKLSGLDLRDANLRGAYLESADLSESDLSYADLSGANLSKANIGNAIFYGAMLTSVNLERVSGNNANFSFALIDQTNLRAASLPGAKLWGAAVMHSDLTGASMLGAKAELATFIASTLDRAEFANSELYLARFYWDNLRGTHFGQSSQLLGRYSVTHAECVEFIASDIRNANFGDTHLAGTVFRDVRLNGADFRLAVSRHARHTPFPVLSSEVFSVVNIDLDSDEEHVLREKMTGCLSAGAVISFDTSDKDPVCAREKMDSLVVMQNDAECDRLRAGVAAELATVPGLSGGTPEWISHADTNEYVRIQLREGLKLILYQMMHSWGVAHFKGTKEMAKFAEKDFRQRLGIDIDADVDAFEDARASSGTTK